MNLVHKLTYLTRLEPTLTNASLTEIGIVFLVFGSEPCTPQFLSLKLDAPPPRITRTVQKLEHAGLIVRNRSPEDKRAMFFTPSNKLKYLFQASGLKEIVENGI